MEFHALFFFFLYCCWGKLSFGQTDNFDFECSILQTLENLKNEVSERAKQVQDAQRSYAFMAQLNQTLTNPASRHVVVFDDVITNVGDAYNNVHGIFKAPVNGTYTFTLVASFPDDAANHKMHLLMKLNTNTVGYIFFDDNTDHWLHRTTTVVLQMNQNDELWTEVGNVIGNYALGGCCFHTHLSGFLVQAD